MKKILVIMIIFCHALVVKASSFNTYLIGNNSINPGETFTLTFGANGASDLYGLNANIEYDHSKLELVSYSGLNGYNLTYGNNKIVLDSSSLKSGNITLATLTFKATSTFVIDESTTITINSIEGGDGNNIFNGNPSSIVIKVVKPKDNNNKLASLSVDGYDIDFKPESNVYYLKVENEVKDLKISASSESNKAKVTGTGTFPVNTYDNEYQIVVTAENGAKNTYRIIVNRADEEGKYSLLNSPLLSVLVVDGYVLDFKNNKFNYSIKIDENVEDLKIFAYPQMADYKVTIEKPDEFVIGENVIKIYITDDKNNESIYTIDVFKSESIKDECQVITNDNDNKKYLFVIVIETIIIGVLSYLFYKNEKLLKNKNKSI